MNARTAYKTIHTFVSKERDMRAYLFQRHPDRRKLKVAEADDVLSALEWLRQAAGVPELPEEPQP